MLQRNHLWTHEFNLVSSTFRFRDVVSWNLLHIANKINMCLFPNKQIPCTVLYSVSTTTSMVCFHDGQIKNSSVQKMELYLADCIIANSPCFHPSPRHTTLFDMKSNRGSSTWAHGIMKYKTGAPGGWVNMFTNKGKRIFQEARMAASHLSCF